MLRTAPAEQPVNRRHRTCWRCGVKWIDSATSYRDDAPCGSCRAGLALEGIPAGAWLRKPRIKSLGDLGHPLHPMREPSEVTA